MGFPPGTRVSHIKLVCLFLPSISRSYNSTLIASATCSSSLPGASFSATMEQCSLLGWLHYGEQEDKAELKRLLAQTTAELEATVLAARDELSRKEGEIVRMRDLLVAAFKERDEANHQSQKLLIEKICLQQQLQLMPQATPASGVSGPVTNAASFSTSDSDESVISEPINHQLATPSSPTLSSSFPPHIVAALGKLRPLPEKGRLLRAVMEAGPTLETLLLAGQLPQWERPPPQLDRVEIPPVTMPCSPVRPRVLTHQDSIASNNCCMVNPNTNTGTGTGTNKKRALDSFDGPLPSPISFPKYQRVVQTS